MVRKVTDTGRDQPVEDQIQAAVEEATANLQREVEDLSVRLDELQAEGSLVEALTTWVNESIILTQGSVNKGGERDAMRERYECALDVQRILRQHIKAA